jgi:hypothetical protein
MKIVLKSRVRKDFSIVADGFNEALFRFLLPPFGLASLVRYDGQKPGDIVHIRFRPPLFNDFKVVIRDVWTGPREYRFVDRGLTMPFRMKFWQHTHRVVSLGEHQTALVDMIEYQTPWWLLDLLIYPLLFLFFLPRTWQYASYYKRLNHHD